MVGCEYRQYCPDYHCNRAVCLVQGGLERECKERNSYERSSCKSKKNCFNKIF
jgi:hypothetical protein